MRATRRSQRFLLAPAVGLLLLAACSGDPEPAEPTEPAMTESPTAEPPEDDDEDATASGGAACLEGEWEADLDVIGQNAISAWGLDGIGADVVVTGTAVMTLDGSTMTSVYDDQQVEVSWSLEDVQWTMAVGYDGTAHGAYTATDTELTITVSDISGVTFETSTHVNGEPVELPGFTDSIVAEFTMGADATYTCTAEELRTQPIEEGFDTSNFMSVLHRR